MTYQITYHGEGGGVTDSDTLHGILGTLTLWVDSNQAVHTRVYQGISHDGENDLMRITFRVEGIPDSEAPDTVLTAIDDLIANEINAPNGTNFPSASEAAQIR